MQPVRPLVAICSHFGYFKCFGQWGYSLAIWKDLTNLDNIKILTMKDEKI
jgi:hypothetical protein